MAKITIDGKDVEISNESMAELRASLLPNGEQLIRDLEPGEYEICGKSVEVSFDCFGHKDIKSIPAKCNASSYIDVDDDVWEFKADFERYIGKPARDITADDIVRIEPMTGTALLDELKPGTVQKINGVLCSVSTSGTEGTLGLCPMLKSDGYAFTVDDGHGWSSISDLSKAINKPVEDLVEDDIVQLYPPKGE